MTIEYEGTRYSGWQAQGNTQKTIQGHLQRAAGQVFGEVDLGGAGRTDAGVHAIGQVAHMRTRKAVEPHVLIHKLNDLLPHDINILDAVRARDDFHARHDAVSRAYLYQIAMRRTAFAKPFVWWIKDRLDVESMQAAASAVAGRHDFSAFTDKRLKEEESRIVVVEKCELAVAGELILVRIAASHFLWKMVRKLISLLVEIGRGTEKDIRSRLHAKAQPWAPTAPPSGLFLESIAYERDAPPRPLVPVVTVERVKSNERAEKKR